jgi:hypothetical protein
VLRGALAGLLTAAVALGVAELVAGLTGPLSSPLIAVGSSAIDLTPIPLKDFAIAHFGSNDKTVLLTGIVAMLAVFAAVIGMLAVRWLSAGLAGLAVFGALGVSAVATRPSVSFTDVLPTLAGVAVASGAMFFLVHGARTDPRYRTGEKPAVDQRTGPGRRGFLAVTAATAVVAVAAGGAGELLLRRFNVAALRAAVGCRAPPSRPRRSPLGSR